MPAAHVVDHEGFLLGITMMFSYGSPHPPSAKTMMINTALLTQNSSMSECLFELAAEYSVFQDGFAVDLKPRVELVQNALETFHVDDTFRHHTFIQFQ